MTYNEAPETQAMIFSIGDRIRIHPDSLYCTDLPNDVYVVEQSYYSDLFSCNHIVLKGIEGAWWEGRFMSVDTVFTLDWMAE